MTESTKEPKAPVPAQQTEAEKRFSTLRSLLEKSKGQIATALPKHLTADRMVRVALTALHRTPALLECSPLSVLGCVIQASELGLELSGTLGQCYMIPRKNRHSGQLEATFQVGYRGMIDLAHRSNRVRTFAAHIVYENDRFEYAYGTNQYLRHVPTTGEQGNAIAAYAVLILANGGNDFEVMSAAEIIKHRDRYAQGVNRSESPWQTAWEEMWKKTPLRRLAKRAPVSIELQRAVMADEYGEAGVSQGFDVIDAARPALPAPPEGRTNLRSNGSGTAPQPTERSEHKDSPHEPPGPSMGEVAASTIDPSALVLEDAIRDLRARLATCQDAKSWHEASADLGEIRDRFDEAGWAKLTGIYTEAHEAWEKGQRQKEAVPARKPRAV